MRDNIILGVMAQAKSDQAKTEAKAARAVQRAAAEAEERAAAEELQKRRAGQLKSARIAIENLEESLRRADESLTRSAAFSSHLKGFYEEIGKLAKGRALLEASDLVVEQANNIVRDAKTIIERDIYLDRIKEFVPAGNNPVYPDVLLTARTVLTESGEV